MAYRSPKKRKPPYRNPERTPKALRPCSRRQCPMPAFGVSAMICDGHLGIQKGGGGYGVEKLEFKAFGALYKAFIIIKTVRVE